MKIDGGRLAVKMVEQSSKYKNLNKLISSSPYMSINELRKEVKKNKHGVEKRKYPEMENKERGREVEERSIWCPVSSLVPRFFFFFQCMCCPKFPPMHVLPGFPLQCMCCPVSFFSPLAAAHFLPKTPPSNLLPLPFSYHFLFPLPSPSCSRPPLSNLTHFSKEKEAISCSLGPPANQVYNIYRKSFSTI